MSSPQTRKRSNATNSKSPRGRVQTRSRSRSSSRGRSRTTRRRTNALSGTTSGRMPAHLFRGSIFGVQSSP